VSNSARGQWTRDTFENDEINYNGDSAYVSGCYIVTHMAGVLD